MRPQKKEEPKTERCWRWEYKGDMEENRGVTCRDKRRIGNFSAIGIKGEKNFGKKQVSATFIAAENQRSQEMRDRF